MRTRARRVIRREWLPPVLYVEQLDDGDLTEEEVQWLLGLSDEDLRELLEWALETPVVVVGEAQHVVNDYVTTDM